MRVRPGQEPFMQKNVPKYTPDWVRTVSVWAESSKRDVSYALCNDRRTLLWFGNQRAVEYHPTLFRTGESEHPTHLVLDLDPPEADAFRLAVLATELVGQALTDSGLQGAVKTSGAKGLHVFVPVADAQVEEIAAATRAVAARAERLDPELATTAFVRDERHGKVFLDATRAGGATVVAAYSPRLRPGTPVSFPVGWADLDAIAPRDFTLRTAPALLDGRDAWEAGMPAPQRLGADLIAEGREIPVARVQAMHEGKRRARARRQAGPDERRPTPLSGRLWRLPATTDHGFSPLAGQGGGYRQVLIFFLEAAVRVGNLAGRLVLITGDTALDVEKASDGGFAADPQAVFARWDEFLEWAASVECRPVTRSTRPSSAPPVPTPRQVFAIGLNYAAHADESQMGGRTPTAGVHQVPDRHHRARPPPWSCPAATPTGRWSSLWPSAGRRTGSSEEAAWGHVAGLMVGQDLSERVVQLAAPAPQFCWASPTRGSRRSARLVTADEFSNPDDLELGCTLGRQLQLSRTSDLIFSVSELIARLSAVCPLLPGDIIFTGTPSGVGNGRTPQAVPAAGRD